MDGDSAVCRASPFDIVVPACNKASRLHGLLAMLEDCRGHGARIIVCDSASSDETAMVAMEAGADTVLRLDRRGKGHAVIAGLKASRMSTVFLCDADVMGLSRTDVATAMAPLSEARVMLARLHLNRPLATAPVTRLVAKPLLRALGVELLEPLGGLAGVRRAETLELHLPGGWGFDVAMTMQTVRSDKHLVEVDASGVNHRAKALDDYVEMAEEVVVAVMRSRGLIPWDHRDCVRCAPARAVTLAPPQAAAAARPPRRGARAW